MPPTTMAPPADPRVSNLQKQVELYLIFIHHRSTRICGCQTSSLSGHFSQIARIDKVEPARESEVFGPVRSQLRYWYSKLVCNREYEYHFIKYHLIEYTYRGSDTFGG